MNTKHFDLHRKELYLRSLLLIVAMFLVNPYRTTFSWKRDFRDAYIDTVIASLYYAILSWFHLLTYLNIEESLTLMLT